MFITEEVKTAAHSKYMEAGYRLAGIKHIVRNTNNGTGCILKADIDFAKAALDAIIAEKGAYDRG